MPALYSLYRTDASQYYRDITGGANGKYAAGPGYDLVTGMGTPHTDQLVPALAQWSGSGPSKAASTATSPSDRMAGISWLEVAIIVSGKKHQDGPGSAANWLD